MRFFEGFEKRADSVKQQIGVLESAHGRRVNPEAYRAAYDRERSRLLAKGWKTKTTSDRAHLDLHSHDRAQNSGENYWAT